jgi:hypothetical protein
MRGFDRHSKRWDLFALHTIENNCSLVQVRGESGESELIF